MKKLNMILLLSLMVLAFGVSSALATPMLYKYGINIDASISEMAWWDSSGTLPGAVDASGFNDFSGLGTLTVTLHGEGDHFVGAYFDHDIMVNNLNDYGTANGALAAGQSWEIGRYNNLLAGLDNTNAFPSGSANNVAMAMGWDFTLDASAEAIITLILTNDINEIDTSLFYLAQRDQATGESIYFSSTFVDPRPDSGTAPVPEPATMLLVGSGLIGLAGFRKKFRKK